MPLRLRVVGTCCLACTPVASHPSERLRPWLGAWWCSCGNSCGEFSEILVSYLGVDSPVASSPGVMGASFSGYSGGRHWGFGRTFGRYASAGARAFISPTAFDTLSSRRGEVLWEREAAGSGSPGAVSSESAAGLGRLRGFGGSGLSRCAARVRERGLWVGMVPCVRVSRVSLVCPGSSVSFYLHSTYCSRVLYAFTHLSLAAPETDRHDRSRGRSPKRTHGRAAADAVVIGRAGFLLHDRQLHNSQRRELIGCTVARTPCGERRISAVHHRRSRRIQLRRSRQESAHQMARPNGAN